MAQRQTAQETLDDVNRYLRTIDAHLRRYRVVLDKITVLEGRRSAKAADERQELIVTRKDAKESYIQAKQTARGLIAMLAVTDSGLAAAKESELKLLQVRLRSGITGGRATKTGDDVTASLTAQETFRDLDREFKSLSAAAERHELLGRSASGSGSSSARGVSGSRAAQCTCVQVILRVAWLGCSAFPRTPAGGHWREWRRRRPSARAHRLHYRADEQRAAGRGDRHQREHYGQVEGGPGDSGGHAGHRAGDGHGTGSRQGEGEWSTRLVLSLERDARAGIALCCRPTACCQRCRSLASAAGWTRSRGSCTSPAS